MKITPRTLAKLKAAATDFTCDEKKQDIRNIICKIYTLKTSLSYKLTAREEMALAKAARILLTIV